MTRQERDLNQVPQFVVMLFIVPTKRCSCRCKLLLDITAVIALPGTR